MKYKVPFIRPVFPSADEISQDYQKIVASNWYTNFGPYEHDLSVKTGEYIGTDVYATTVVNCTLGLDIAVLALFETSKKKVLTQAFTFAAGPEVLIRNGFEPVFIDIQDGTWQMNTEHAERFLERSAKDVAGILLCNTFGVGNPHITTWEQLAAKYNLPLIVDSAAGFGSKYNDTELIGARGDCEVFSLHATKPFAVGGGLITSRNEQLIRKLRSLQNFGFESDRLIHSIGMNAKMQELNCAIGLRQLVKLPALIATRQDKLKKYKESLERHGYVFQLNDEKSTVPFVSVLVPCTVDVSDVQRRLQEQGVETRRYYTPALHEQKIIMKHAAIPNELSVTEDVCRRIISLPLHSSMTDNDIMTICNTLLEVQ